MTVSVAAGLREAQAGGGLIEQCVCVCACVCVCVCVGANGCFDLLWLGSVLG